MNPVTATIHLFDDARVCARVDDGYACVDVHGPNDLFACASVFVHDLGAAIALRDAAQEILSHYLNGTEPTDTTLTVVPDAPAHNALVSWDIERDVWSINCGCGYHAEVAELSSAAVAAANHDHATDPVAS